MILFIAIVLFTLALGCVLAFFAFFTEVSGKPLKFTPLYQYTKKRSLVTQAELIFFKALNQAIGNEYQIFTQVHLDALFDHTVRGQNWKGALSHIQRKSVDFVLCDKTDLSPVVAIELDDSSHQRWDRVERDVKVGAIFESVGIPLLRLKQGDIHDIEGLKQKILEKIKL
jgi:hypothetical protein